MIESITKYELFDNPKSRALNVCMDIYGDVGKFLKDMDDEQEGIFKDLAEQALKLTRVEYDFIQLDKERKQNEELSLENRVFEKSVRLEKELKRLKKQKDEYLAEINHLEAINKQYLDTMFRHAKGDKGAYTGLNMPQQTRTHISVPTQLVKPPPTIPPPTIPSPTVPSHNISRNFPNQHSSAPNNRLLTLKQLK